VIKVLAKYKLKPDAREEYLKLARELVNDTIKQKGCLYYSIHEDINEPLILAMLEEWDDKESLDEHNKRNCSNRIVQQLKNLRESAEISVFKVLDCYK
jgi:quinol monooxygenase YgiN